MPFSVSKAYKTFYPPSDWDKVLESKESSLYYSLLVRHFGHTQAEYYWNRRQEMEQTRDNYYLALCKDINQKCDNYLKKYGAKQTNA